MSQANTRNSPGELHDVYFIDKRYEPGFNYHSNFSSDPAQHWSLLTQDHSIHISSKDRGNLPGYLAKSPMHKHDLELKHDNLRSEKFKNLTYRAKYLGKTRYDINHILMYARSLVQLKRYALVSLSRESQNCEDFVTSLALMILERHEKMRRDFLRAKRQAYCNGTFTKISGPQVSIAMLFPWQVLDLLPQGTDTRLCPHSAQPRLCSVMTRGKEHQNLGWRFTKSVFAYTFSQPTSVQRAFKSIEKDSLETAQNACGNITDGGGIQWCDGLHS